MTDYKIILGIISSIISIGCYLPYIYNVVKGRTKPHFFSWFIWGLIMGIAFFAQTIEGAGTGAWATGLTGVSCLDISILAIFYGEKKILTSDVWIFIGALSSLVLWVITDQPLIAVILVTITDALAFSITFKKAYFKPHEETISSFILAVIGFIISLFALESVSLTTWLYPAAVAVMDGLFALMVWRRRETLRLLNN